MVADDVTEAERYEFADVDRVSLQALYCHFSEKGLTTPSQADVEREIREVIVEDWNKFAKEVKDLADVIKKEHASNNKQDPLTNKQCEDFLDAFDKELKRQNKQYRAKKEMIQKFFEESTFDAERFNEFKKHCVVH